MKYLLDEQLDELTARALDVLAQPFGNAFEHLLDHAPQRTDDADIPGICRDHGCETLVTVNVRDFGAKKVYFEALLASGVHVVVVRPGKARKLFPHVQTGFLAMHMGTIFKHVQDADGPILVRVAEGGAVVRTLGELVAEIEGAG